MWGEEKRDSLIKESVNVAGSVRKRAERNGSFCMSDQWYLINEDNEV